MSYQDTTSTCGLSIRKRGNHSLGSIEQRNQISYQRYRWIRSHPSLYPKDSSSSCFHSCVDLFFGYSFVYNCEQKSGRSGRGRYTLCSTDQFAVQFRNNQTDCFCSTSAVRNDINSACTASSQIAFSLRSVKDHLITSVSMDGAHDTRLDRRPGRSELLPSVPGSWWVQEAAEITVSLFGQSFVVYVVYDSRQIISSRSGNNYFSLAPAVMMCRSFLFRGVESGTLQNYIYADSLPTEAQLR